MSWLSNLLRKESFKLILKLGERILKIFLGKLAQSVQDIAFEEVIAAEQSGKSGLDKYQLVFKRLKERFPDIKNSALNLAIEVSIAAMQGASRKS